MSKGFNLTSNHVAQRFTFSTFSQLAIAGLVNERQSAFSHVLLHKMAVRKLPLMLPNSITKSPELISRVQIA